MKLFFHTFICRIDFFMKQTKNKDTMRMRTPLFSTAIAVLLLQACQEAAPPPPPPMDMDALKSEIQILEDRYAAGENAKDVDAIMTYYADDAQSLPDDEPTVVGKDAIRARLAQNLAKDTSGNTIKFMVQELFAGGDYVVEIGSSVTTDPAGNQVSSGKYMTLFKKEGESYVAIRDIWNGDKKAEMPAAAAE